MPLRPLSRDLIHGSIGFAVVSVAAFSVWAFAGRWFPTEISLYAAIAGVFLGGTGLLLAPLAGTARRFWRAFPPAFLVYAVVWCAAWFGLGGKLGEWVGAVAGGMAFAVISMMLLGNARGWPGAALAFLALHCAGYFAGDWAYAYASAHGKELADSVGWTSAEVRTAGKLAWGLLYGLGFGAGMGWVFNRSRLQPPNA